MGARPVLQASLAIHLILLIIKYRHFQAVGRNYLISIINITFSFFSVTSIILLNYKLVIMNILNIF